MGNQKLKTIVLGDGTEAQVDQDRFDAFEKFMGNYMGNLPSPRGRLEAKDAAEALAFSVSQLAFTEQGVLERKYRPLQFEELIPLDYSAGPAADTIRYEIMDKTGVGKPYANRADTVPTANVMYADRSMAVKTGAIGYDYTQMELIETAFLKRPINAAKAAAAVEAYRRHINVVALSGESVTGLTGLYNNADVPVGSPLTGTWSTATADEILADINDMIHTVWAATQYNETPDTFLYPPSVSPYLLKPRTTTADKTVLEFIQANNVGKLEKGIDITFRAGYDLGTAGATGGTRCVLYTKDPSHVKMHIPVPVQFLAPQLKGLLVQVPGWYKYSGVAFYYPTAALYVDGV